MYNYKSEENKLSQKPMIHEPVLEQRKLLSQYGILYCHWL